MTNVATLVISTWFIRQFTVIRCAVLLRITLDLRQKNLYLTWAPLFSLCLAWLSVRSA